MCLMHSSWEDPPSLEGGRNSHPFLAASGDRGTWDMLHAEAIAGNIVDHSVVDAQAFQVNRGDSNHMGTVYKRSLSTLDNLFVQC